MSKENVALVRSWFEEVWNNRREDLIDETIAEQSVCYTDDGEIRGPHGFRQQQYLPMLAAFPDLHIEIDGVIAEGDQVAVRWTATGMHSGDGLGFRATQEPITVRGMTWVVVRDGVMHEGWQSSGLPELVRGLAAKAAAM